MKNKLKVNKEAEEPPKAKKLKVDDADDAARKLKGKLNEDDADGAARKPKGKLKVDDAAGKGKGKLKVDDAAGKGKGKLKVDDADDAARKRKGKLKVDDVKLKVDDAAKAKKGRTKNLPHRGDLIMVDQENEAILFPISGKMVSFHISTVKRVTCYANTSSTVYVEVNFDVPVEFDDSIYIKHVTFQCKRSARVSELVKSIWALQRHVKGVEETLVTKTLELAESEPPTLRNLLICEEQLHVTLEAHRNGFRFTTSREEAHIMFENVKHAFFLPPKNEKTILHFHLHNNILVGKKKKTDVQFYYEVKETVAGGKRSARESRETRDRKNIIIEFQDFVTRVKDIWQRPDLRPLGLEFEQPIEEFGFDGWVHEASSSFIVPTANCLVNLLSMPFMVITIKEIQEVKLEKVGSHDRQKHFDMTIVFRDFAREVMQIRLIDISLKDNVKKWLDTTGVNYHLGELPVNWNELLDRNNQRAPQFVVEGGRERLNLEADDSDDEDYELDEVQIHSGSEDEDDEN